MYQNICSRAMENWPTSPGMSSPASSLWLPYILWWFIIPKQTVKALRTYLHFPENCQMGAGINFFILERFSLYFLKFKPFLIIYLSWVSTNHGFFPPHWITYRSGMLYLESGHHSGTKGLCIFTHSLMNYLNIWHLCLLISPYCILSIFLRQFGF